MIDNNFKTNGLPNSDKIIKKGEAEEINAAGTDPNLTGPEFKSKKNGQEIKKNVPLVPTRKGKLSSFKKFLKSLKIGKKKKHKQSDDVANPNPNKNNSLEKQSKTGESNEGNIPVSSIESNKIESLDDKIADYTNFLEKLKNTNEEGAFPECLYKEFEELKASGDFDKVYPQIKKDAESLLMQIKRYISYFKEVKVTLQAEQYIPKDVLDKIELCKACREGRVSSKLVLSSDAIMSFGQNEQKELEKKICMSKDYLVFTDMLRGRYGEESIPQSLRNDIQNCEKNGRDRPLLHEECSSLIRLVRNTKDYADLIRDFGKGCGKAEIPKFISRLEEKYGAENVPQSVRNDLKRCLEKGSSRGVSKKKIREMLNLVKNTKDYDDVVQRIGQNRGQNHISKYMLEELKKYREEGRKEPVPQEWFDGNEWKLGDPTISDDFERLDLMYDSTHDEIENPLFNSQLEAKGYDPFDEPFDDDDM